MTSRSSSGLSTISAWVLESSCSWRTVVDTGNGWGQLRKNRPVLKIFWHYCGATTVLLGTEGTELWDWNPFRASWDIPKAFLVWRHCHGQHSLKCTLHIPEVQQQQGQHQNNPLNISRFLLLWRNLGWFPSRGVKLSINPQLLYNPCTALERVTCCATATRAGPSATALWLQGATHRSHNSGKSQELCLGFPFLLNNHYLKPLKMQGLKNNVTRTQLTTDNWCNPGLSRIRHVRICFLIDRTGTIKVTKTMIKRTVNIQEIKCHDSTELSQEVFAGTCTPNMERVWISQEFLVDLAEVW